MSLGVRTAEKGEAGEKKEYINGTLYSEKTLSSVPVGLHRLENMHNLLSRMTLSHHWNRSAVSFFCEQCEFVAF